MYGIVVIVALVAGAVFIVGMFVTIVKVAAARDMAARRGDDHDAAARVTLLGGNIGLAATYLKTPNQSSGAADEPARSSAERLAELEVLRRERLITDEEAAKRRAEIIAEI